MDAIMAIFADFDLAAFLPKVDTLLGWIELVLRICVMAGPLLLLGYGLVYLLAPPREANYSVGHRFWWSMASLDAWQFTHNLIGIIWSAMGLLLTIIMAFICNAFRRMETMDMVWTAVKCLCWELGLTLVSVLAVNIVVMVVFDRTGYRRNEYDE